MGSLSEDMRLGAMATEQGHGEYLSFRNKRACAVGAICVARGTPTERGVKQIEHDLDLLGTHPCPQCLADGVRFERPTGNMIIHLNDRHRWTREEIADWLAPIEQQKKAQREAVAVTA